jgi:poly(A) polymerase
MAAISDQHPFALEIVLQLRAAGHIALFAGGCVRDSLLGREAKDYDIATTARPEQVRKLFGHRRTLAVGASFGVIMVLAPQGGGQVEVATFRTEGPYLDGRRPESVAFCTPEEDARRRDFTINGMFFDPVKQRVLDFVSGEQDLNAKIVRAIGNPHERFREDKLRMLRAVRFTATLGFSLDPETADAIRAMASDLIVVSSERIAQELKKMLLDPHRRRAIQLTEDVELIRVIFPELDSVRRQSEWTIILQGLEELRHPTFELAMALLLKELRTQPNPRAICLRLRLSNDETDRITWLVAHQSDLDNAPTLSLAKLKQILAHRYRDDLLEMHRVQQVASSSPLVSYQFCVHFLKNTPPEVLDPVPFVTGDDLIAMGFKPGPRFKSILDTTRMAQLNLELLSRDEALDRVKQAWDQEPPRP